MKKLIILFNFILLILSNLYSQNLNIDDILSKYISITGFDKLQNVKTIVMNGSITQNDLMPVKIIKVRPNKYKMIYDVQDVTAFQVYDGQKGWMTAPWTGNPNPQILSEDKVKELKSRADFDSPLYNWKSKGHNAELLGTENFDIDSVYKIKLTKKEGNIEYYFINSKSFLLEKKNYTRISRGKEIEMETYFKEYKSVNGILFSFLNENYMGGQPYSSIQFDSIELDQKIDESIFEMPLSK